MSNPTAHDVILAAFAADSFSLGAHWEYNTDKIHERFGKLTIQVDPISKFHPTKRAGDQTHIGDTAIMMMESIAASSAGTFDAETYRHHWIERWQKHDAYRDHATTTTIANLKEGRTGTDAASDDDDMSHASKFFPLLAVHRTSEDDLVKATRLLVSICQRSSNQIVVGEFLARVAFRILHRRLQPTAAVESVLGLMSDAWLHDRIALGRNSAKMADLDAIRSYGDSSPFGDMTFYSGLSCGSKNGLPALIHYLHKYENRPDPSEAIIEDVNIGGNSNARSIAIATMLCAWRGVAFPKIQEWIANLRHRIQIIELLAKIEH